MDHVDLNLPLEEFLRNVPGPGLVIGQLGLDRQREGHVPLGDLCQMHGWEPRTFLRLLAAWGAAEASLPPGCLELMPLPELCDHLARTWQKVLKDELERFDQRTRALTERFGAEEPRLRRVRHVFRALRDFLGAHVAEETGVVFPLIRRLIAGPSESRTAWADVRARLARLEREHEQAEEALDELRTAAGVASRRRLSSASLSRQVAEAIVRLEQVVHEQIYIENRILFARVSAIRGSA